MLSIQHLNIFIKSADFSLELGADVTGTFGVSAQGTLFEVGYSSNNFDAGLLIGSAGLDVKLTKNSFTFGISWGWGFKFTIRW